MYYSVDLHVGNVIYSFLVYEVAVDLWYNTIAMNYPFPRIPSLF